jgi:hypothetical protein
MFLGCFYYCRCLFVAVFIAIFIVGLFSGDIRFSCLRLVCIPDLFAFS